MKKPIFKIILVKWATITRLTLEKDFYCYFWYGYISLEIVIVWVDKDDVRVIGFEVVSLRICKLLLTIYIYTINIILLYSCWQ